MKVIIPAAGVGSRLRPHTHTLPKALVHVAGKPILGHILDRVACLTPEETIIVTGFMGEKVQEYAPHHFPGPIRFVEQQDLLGLGYAVHMALEKAADDPVLIILGDTIVDADLKSFVAPEDNQLAVMAVKDPQRFGIAEVRDGHIASVVEKPAHPKSDLAIIGLYSITDTPLLRKHLDRLVEKDIRTNGEIELTDALQGMIDDGAVFRAASVDGWYDCGQRESLIATNRYLLGTMAPQEPIAGCVIIPPVYVAPTAIIEESVIGPYVSVSDKAVVRHSIIKNSIVGYEAEVENALLTDSVVGHRAVVYGDLRALNMGDSSEIRHF
ncbi:MAG: NTP transferase domain-containing protein [candidate division Zixibacteria bacterium]|nr:NTP transferase domain-containing protein [candidate division Zixibacteria bacterium]